MSGQKWRTSGVTEGKANFDGVAAWVPHVLLGQECDLSTRKEKESEVELLCAEYCRE